MRHIKNQLTAYNEYLVSENQMEVTMPEFKKLIDEG
jgi:hypothetical protein